MTRPALRPDVVPRSSVFCRLLLFWHVPLSGAPVLLLGRLSFPRSASFVFPFVPGSAFIRFSTKTLVFSHSRLVLAWMLVTKVQEDESRRVMVGWKGGVEELDAMGTAGLGIFWAGSCFTGHSPDLEARPGCGWFKSSPYG